MYHYKDCGLENVYLKNGYRIEQFGQETAVSIEDARGLHQAIIRNILSKPTGLTGQEFRFLRIEMDLSQARLARLLGVSDQALAKWEKSMTKGIPGPSERLARALAYETLLNKTGAISDLLQGLSNNDEKNVIDYLFEETAEGWNKAA